MFKDDEPVNALNDYYNHYEKPPKMLLPNNDKTLNCDKHTKDINSGINIIPSNFSIIIKIIYIYMKFYLYIKKLILLIYCKYTLNKIY